MLYCGMGDAKKRALLSSILNFRTLTVSFTIVIILAALKSRTQILNLADDGVVEPPGSLATQPYFNYNHLISVCLGPDTPEGKDLIG